jgi:hypothetical protein
MKNCEEVPLSDKGVCEVILSPIWGASPGEIKPSAKPKGMLG